MSRGDKIVWPPSDSRKAKVVDVDHARLMVTLQYKCHGLLCRQIVTREFLYDRGI